MEKFTQEQIELMRRACLLCDKSDLDIKTGCVVVKEGDVVTEGWNINKEPIGHAEMEAIKKAHNQGLILNSCTAYVTRFPCEACAKILIHCCFKEIFYMSNHVTSNNGSLPILLAANISVVQIPEEEVWR